MRALLLLSLLLSCAVRAYADVPVAPPPELDARAYVLVDYHSHQVLAGRNADQRIDPASLTKLMTAYVAFAAIQNKQIALSQTVTASERARNAAGIRMLLDAKKPVTVDELLHGLVVDSANDAAVALAELVGGGEDNFVTMMNVQAQRLELAHTHFVNATGQPDAQQYSTARDLALLGAAIIRDFPKFYALYALKEYTYNNVRQANQNRLLWTDPAVDGIKTGHTDASGYCLIASAKRGERRLVSVVLDAGSETTRAIESQKLLNYGFTAFDSVKLYGKDQAVSSIRVWKGSSNYADAGFPDDFYITLPKGQSDKLKATLESRQPLIAPVDAGKLLGTLKLTLDDQPYLDVPVVALKTVPLAGVLGRGWDSILLFFK